MNSNITRLNRFTTLPVLLDFLERKKLVLLDPKSWDDKNDTEVILAYKEKKGIEKLFALCFTHDYETIHHWKTFANGSSGCCIEFDADKLIQIFKKAKLRHGIVEYKKIKEATPNSFKLHQMPFIKRKPYECEQEYRIIWEGDTDTNVFELDVPLDTINKITISQQMPEQVFITIKNLLKKTFDDPEKRISRSTIYENQRWINSFKKYDLS
jgi:hypothetical protein